MPPAALGWEAAGQAWSPCPVHSPSSELHHPAVERTEHFKQNTEKQEHKPLHVYTVHSHLISMRNYIISKWTGYRLIGQHLKDIHPDFFKAGGTGWAPYLRNPLIAGSTRLRRKSPQGDEHWWGSFNKSTISRGNKKRLQTNNNKSRALASFYNELHI